MQVGIMDQVGKWNYDAVQRQVRKFMRIIHELIDTKGAENVVKALGKAKEAENLDKFLIHVSAIGADSTSSIPYARTKGQGEEAIRNYLNSVENRSVHALIIRPGLVIGRGDQFLNVQ